MRETIEDALFGLAEWFELHLTALKMGVSASWLRDRRDRYYRLIAETSLRDTK